MPEEAYEVAGELIEDVGSPDIEFVGAYYDGQSTKIDHEDRWYAVLSVDFGFGKCYVIVEIEDKGVYLVGAGNGRNHSQRMAESYSGRDEPVRDV